MNIFRQMKANSGKICLATLVGGIHSSSRKSQMKANSGKICIHSSSRKSQMKGGLK